MNSVRAIGFVLPRYIGTLPLHHPVQNSIYQCIRTAAADGEKMRDVQKLCRTLEENGIRRAGKRGQYGARQRLGGRACGRTGNRILRHCRRTQTGIQVQDDADLIRVLEGFRCGETAVRTAAWCARSGISDRLRHCDAVGGGLSLEEPEIVRQGGRYGVRLRASAPSIHMMRANIKAEVNPIVGTEKQSEELVHYLLSEFEEQPEKIWGDQYFPESRSMNSCVRNCRTN